MRTVAATAAALYASAFVSGVILLTVSDAAGFAGDSGAVAAMAEAIAQELRVVADDVDVTPVVVEDGGVEMQ